MNIFLLAFSLSVTPIQESQSTWEASLFPNGEEAYKHSQRTKKYLDWLQAKSRLGKVTQRNHAAEVELVEWSLASWCCLCGVYNYSSYPFIKKKHLDELRALLGDEWYFQGRMPVVVPDWFKEEWVP